MSEGDARSLGQDAQETLRLRGVRLLEHGRTQAEVAGLLDVSERAVQEWSRRFRGGGWAALRRQRRGRRAGEQQALSAGAQERLSRSIAGRCPDQLQLPGLLWTRSAVQALIERETGTRLEITTVGRYLRSWGFTLKRPVKRALEQDPVVVAAWLTDVYPELDKRAGAEGALILWGDESGIRLQQLDPKAGYAPRGQRAVAKTAGTRATANMISAIANSGQMSFRVFDGRFTAEVFIDFLDRLLRTHPDRKLYLVVDNHSTHRAKKVRAWLAREGRHERLELVFLPAYSPELNPDELLNPDIKRHLRAQPTRPADRRGLVKALRSFLHSVQRQPARVSNYLHGEHVTYAGAA